MTIERRVSNNAQFIYPSHIFLPKKKKKNEKVFFFFFLKEEDHS